MPTLFEGDEDSDVERAKNQRRILQSIREEAGKIPDDTLNIESIDDVHEQLSEEGELQKLRENTRYRQYVAGRKRNRSASPQGAKRPRSKVCDVHLTERDDGQVGSNDQRQKLHQLVEDGDSFSDAERKYIGLDGEDLRTEPLKRRKALMARKELHSGPTVDPKVLDDSSDDASASEASDDAPIGPVLPDTQPTGYYPKELVAQLPIQNEAVLGDNHTSYVSSIAIDRSGNRLVTASIDSSVILWDFNSMDRSLRSFRKVNPLDDAPVRNLQYSATGGLLLCSGETSSVIVLDRDGDALSQTAKGDMYMVDMARTKGHRGPVLSAKWRPGTSSGKFFATTSADATLRLWDAAKTSKLPMTDLPVITQLRLSKLRTERGGKTVASAMDWAHDGKSCAIGCSDGTVKVVDPDAYSIRPIGQSRVFASQDTEITSVTCAPESCHIPLILVRSTDDCLRVFDRRNMYDAVCEMKELPNAVSETNTCFVGESGACFVTGTSTDRRNGRIRGTLRMFESNTFSEIWRSNTEEEAGSVVSAIWHKELNQLLYGCSDGRVRVLYHPDESHKGVLQALSKSDYRKKHGIASVGLGEVYLPSTVYRRRGVSGSSGSMSGMPLSRREASEVLKPKHRVGLSPHLLTKSQSLAKQLFSKDISKDWAQNPREAILRYAEVAERDPVFMKAYKETQPQTLLAEKTAEQEEEETRQAIFDRDKFHKRHQSEAR